jgi:hypothetical protein
MIKAQQSCSVKKKVANSRKKRPKVGKSQRNINFSSTFPDFWSLFLTICCFFNFLFYRESWVKHRDIPKYKEGDLVWLEGKNLCINQPTAKLVPRRHGPFKIIQVMSAVNYCLELPTQWSIHPVFHIDLLMPYRETTMHGPNFTQPAPELIDGEEEYSMEKILDSRRFGRRRRLQYLVKWEGYPDSDNMWVNKDDVSADDKIQEFKTSNPKAEVHLRQGQVVTMPYPLIPIPHTLHSSLILQNSMSSDADSTLPYEYPTGAYPNSPLALGSESAADITAAFHQMSIHTPTRLSPNSAAVQAEEVVYAVSFPNDPIIRDVHRFSVALGANTGSAMEAGSTQSQPPQQGNDSCSVTSDNNDDLSICPICTSEQAYCHCPPHALSTSPSPLPIPPRSSSPRHVGQIELNHEQAEVLVTRLAASLDTHHENPIAVSGEREPPPNTPQELGESHRNSPPKESRFWTYLLEDVKTEDVGDLGQYVMLDQMLTHGQYVMLDQMLTHGQLQQMRD